MLGAIYIGLSGMGAYSKGLQTISNNVANLNSSGFKSATATFSDVFTTGSGSWSVSADPGAQRQGSGVRFATPQLDFGQGDLRQSDNDLDLAIQGTGFMVLLNEGAAFYTRTGSFTADKDGYIVHQESGYRLGALENGSAVPVNITASRANPPVATSTVKFADNISSTGTGATVQDIAVYDSLGNKQLWRAQFDPVTGSPGQWTVSVTDQTQRTIGTSTLRFQNGAVDPATTTLTFTDTPAGADPLSVAFDFSSGVTSFSTGTTSSIRASSTDGNAAGEISNVTVDDDGALKITYSNGKAKSIGAVAMASFRDPQALQQVSGGLFRNAGNEQPMLVTSADDGVGTLTAKRLEASNVDLSQEFGDLILIQRGFQASSQVVSISNDMIQQLFGIRGQG